MTEAIKGAKSEEILSRENPGAVCWGISVLVRDLSRAANLKCDFVNGNSKWLGDKAPRQSDRNHGTVCYVFKNGDAQFKVPADVSIARATMQYENATTGIDGLRWKPKGKIFSQFILPRTTVQWEIFLARFNTNIGPNVSISGDKQSSHLILNMSYDEWAGNDTSALNALNKYIVNTEEKAGAKSRPNSRRN